MLSAFTATATDLVKDDIIKLLDLQDPFTRSTGFNRENLLFEVRHPNGKSNNKFAELMAYLNTQVGKSGIIYCATRKTVDQVADKLNNLGIPAARYHAGLTQQERITAQQDFIFDRVPVIVATNAFGMGIDKSNVSFVVHYNMPKNMESYYQEAGRAGRDGTPAECVILFNRQDIMINQFLIENSEGDNKAREYKRLREMETYCNTTACLRQYILDYFQDEGEYGCDNCSNCKSSHEMADVTVEAQKILSCIHRMRGRFGLALVIDVLRGAQTKKVKGAGLDSLKTYGIMKDQAPDEIRKIALFLIQMGYVKVMGDQYPVVQVTEKAKEVLHDGMTVKMPTVKADGPLPADGLHAADGPPLAAYAVDDGLFEKLRKLRLHLAEKERVPAFVIFSDATLYDMCAKLPEDDRSFLNVSGVGVVKLKKYGQVFLDVIKEF